MSVFLRTMALNTKLTNRLSTLALTTAAFVVSCNAKDEGKQVDRQHEKTTQEIGGLHQHAQTYYGTQDGRSPSLAGEAGIGSPQDQFPEITIGSKTLTPATVLTILVSVQSWKVPQLILFEDPGVTCEEWRSHDGDHFIAALAPSRVGECYRAA